jgi:hypothetical protein
MTNCSSTLSSPSPVVMVVVTGIGTPNWNLVWWRAGESACWLSSLSLTQLVHQAVLCSILQEEKEAAHFSLRAANTPEVPEKEGWRHDSSGRIPSMKPWVHTPGPPKKQGREKEREERRKRQRERKRCYAAGSVRLPGHFLVLWFSQTEKSSITVVESEFTVPWMLAQETELQLQDVKES